MRNFMRWLVPSEEKFFEMLLGESKNMLAAANAFKEFIDEYNSLSLHARQLRVDSMKEFEHTGDNLQRAIIYELNKAFLTPFDGEDIHQLAVLTDVVVDIMDLISRRLLLYELQSVDTFMVKLAELLQRCAMEIHAGMDDLRHLKDIQEHSARTSQLEEDADRVTSEAIAALFKEENDPKELIKRKEIIEGLEHAIDTCEHIAHVFDAVVVKHG